MTMKHNMHGFSLLSIMMFLFIEGFLMVSVTKSLIKMNESYQIEKQTLMDQQRLRFAVYFLLNGIHHAHYVRTLPNANLGSILQLDDEKFYVASTHRQHAKNHPILGLYHQKGFSPSEELVENVSSLRVIEEYRSSLGNQLMTIKLTVGRLSWTLKVNANTKKDSF